MRMEFDEMTTIGGHTLQVGDKVRYRAAVDKEDGLVFKLFAVINERHDHNMTGLVLKGERVERFVNAQGFYENKTVTTWAYCSAGELELVEPLEDPRLSKIQRDYMHDLVHKRVFDDMDADDAATMYCSSIMNDMTDADTAEYIREYLGSGYLKSTPFADQQSLDV